MRVVTTDREGARLDLSYDELALLFGALLEAAEALSAAEFRARLGRDETDADALRSVLKPVILSARTATAGGQRVEVAIRVPICR
jgi:hypothetical protein